MQISCRHLQCGSWGSISQTTEMLSVPIIPHSKPLQKNAQERVVIAMKYRHTAASNSPQSRSWEHMLTDVSGKIRGQLDDIAHQRLAHKKAYWKCVPGARTQIMDTPAARSPYCTCRRHFLAFVRLYNGKAMQASTYDRTEHVLVVQTQQIRVGSMKSMV